MGFELKHLMEQLIIKGMCMQSLVKLGVFIILPPQKHLYQNFNVFSYAHISANILP